MNSYRGFEYLETFEEMEARHKQWHTAAPVGNMEEIFVDEFSNSQYHEEEPDWKGIAEALSKKQRCDILLVLIHWLASQREIDPGTEELKTVMSFYEALLKWAKNEQENPMDILDSLEKMKDLLEAVAKREGATWGEGLRLFQLIYLGIYSGLGISISSGGAPSYDDIIQDLYDPR